MVLDTLGLHVFGLPDLQCHFRDRDPGEIAGLLYATALYVFDSGDVIADGNTISGPDGDGALSSAGARRRCWSRPGWCWTSTWGTRTPPASGTGSRCLVSDWYHSGMAMTLRLTDEQDRMLTDLARAEGISKQDAVVRAIVDRASEDQRRVRMPRCGAWPERPSATTARCLTAWLSDGLPRAGGPAGPDRRRLGVGPVRDLGLLDSAAHRPQTSLFGEDAYPDLHTKAAVLLESLTRNHALVDGNKRLALGRGGRLLRPERVCRCVAPEDDAYDLVIGVATGESDESRPTLALGSWRVWVSPRAVLRVRRTDSSSISGR